MSTILDELRATGVAKVGAMSPGDVAEANAWLCSRPVYADFHVPVHAKLKHLAPVPRAYARSVCECFCVSNTDALKTPHAFEWAVNRAAPVVRAFLEREPVMYSANAFWTRPGSAPPRWDTQEFHVDQDDLRFIPMFVYLTDVLEEQDGPQELVGPDAQKRQVYGHAGTVFLANTMLPHRGLKPARGERGLLWVRFGISERPPANVWDQIEPIPIDEFGAERYPADAAQREMVKLLVR